MGQNHVSSVVRCPLTIPFSTHKPAVSLPSCWESASALPGPIHSVCTEVASAAVCMYTHTDTKTTYQSGSPLRNYADMNGGRGDCGTGQLDTTFHQQYILWHRHDVMHVPKHNKEGEACTVIKMEQRQPGNEVLIIGSCMSLINLPNIAPLILSNWCPD